MSGKNPLGNSREPQSYEGINVIVPVGGWQLIRSTRNPTTNDKKYPVGAIWINTSNNTAWLLTSAPGNWSEFAASVAGAVTSLTGDSGGAIQPAAGNITLAGTAAQGISTSGAGSTITFTVADWTTAQKGVGVLSTNAQAIAGTGSTQAVTPLALASKLGTQTNHGVLVGAGTTAAITALAVGSTGQVLIGSTGADPAFGALGVNSALTNHGVILGQNNSAFVATAAGAAGTVLTGNGASSDPTFQAIPALNIVDNTTGTVGSPTTMTVNTTYIADQASATTGFLLPATAAIGTQITVVGNGPGGWQIQQNANQAIKMNSNTTTTGTSGSLSSTNRYNSVTLTAGVAGASTIWVVSSFSGTFTFV